MAKDDKVFPETHLGHHIGPAPTSAEIGLHRKSHRTPLYLSSEHRCPQCNTFLTTDKDGVVFCLECGYEPQAKN